MGGSWIHTRPLSSVTFSTLNMCRAPPWVTCDCLHSLPVSACGLWLTTPRGVVPRPTPSGGWWLLEARSLSSSTTCRTSNLSPAASADPRKCRMRRGYRSTAPARPGEQSASVLRRSNRRAEAAILRLLVADVTIRTNGRRGTAHRFLEPKWRPLVTVNSGSCYRLSSPELG